MGVLTTAEIISNGLNAVGMSELSTPALGWLNKWLDAMANAWRWPHLRKMQTGFPVANINDALALSGLPFGKTTSYPGSGKGVTHIWNTPKRQFKLYTADKKQWYTVNPRVLGSNYGDILPAADVTRGVPVQLAIRQDGHGSVRLFFSPLPNDTYYAAFMYQELPAPITVTTDVPWFPDDETMETLVSYKALAFEDESSPKTVAHNQKLAALVSQQRARHADMGTSEADDLMDRSVFR